MLRKCYYISELSEANLIREAKANKRNPSQHLDFLLSTLGKKETKNGKRSQKARD